MTSVHALIIDDNTQNLKVLGQMLAREGVSCTELTHAADLSTMLPTLPHVDIVFTDLEMPGLNGYGAKDLLRPVLGDVPIIAYTVHAGEINTARTKGFNGFIGKPLDSMRFPSQLARILRGEPVWERI